MLDPALLTVAQTIGALIGAGISLAERLGQRDAFIATLDAGLAAARDRTDRDLEAKHDRP